MSYVTTLHRPSSVRHAIKLNLLSPDEECLVLAKANRVEIWVPTEDGLVMLHSKAIHGRVSMFAKIRPPGAKTDHLFIGTIRFIYFTVAWNPETRQLDTMQKFTDMTEKFIQESNTQDRCLVDPTGKYFILELFQGILNLGKVKQRMRKGGSEDYLEATEQLRITELKIRSTAFLYTEEDRPKVAFLYEEGKGIVKLATYRIIDEKSQYSKFDPSKHRENEIDQLELGATFLIPVPKGEVEQRRYVSRNTNTAKAYVGGVMVVGETRIVYLDDESKAVLTFPLQEATIFVAWDRYDDMTYLLADDYGILHVLRIYADQAVIQNITVRKLGKVATATQLVYLGNGYLFIASHVGDSQLVSIDLDGDVAEPIKILQTMANIAPILDFAVMDLGSREGEGRPNEYASGQARLVTCSGAHGDGSLRSVRSGVGLEDVGILADMQGIRDVYTLKSSQDSPTDDVLVVSFDTESRVFAFDEEGSIEELSTFRGLAMDQHILLAMNLPNGSILQVTPKSVVILGLGPSSPTAQWDVPKGQVITAASANQSQLLLSSNGTTLVSLDIQGGLREVAVEPLSNDDQIACIFVSKEIPNIGLVGFWKSGSLSILTLNDLKLVHSEDLRRSNNASIPRDIVLTQVLPTDRFGPSLFVAMEDGIVLTFNVDRTNLALSGRKSIVLGTQQARFQILPGEGGLFNIFAMCEHPSLIYGSEGTIVYSAVTADDAVCVCSFNNQIYPGSIVVATAESLKISVIDTERRTHVQTLPVGKTVRRIAYSPNERAFGIGCVQRDLTKGEEYFKSNFSLVEEVLLGEMGKPFPLGVGLKLPELVECVIRAMLPTEHGKRVPVERFIVGTSFLDDDEEKAWIPRDHPKGRILIFGVDQDKNPFLVHAHNLKGACRKVDIMDGKIVAALVKTVVIYDYHESTAVSAELEKLATYRTSTLPVDLEVTDNTIVVADMMKSVSILEYIPGEDGIVGQLKELARHHEACWSTGVSRIAENIYLETDQEGNLIILNHDPNAIEEKQRSSLKVIGGMNLGEMVNKIQRISLNVTSEAVVAPKAFLATTEGSIYLLSMIAPKHFTNLWNLQVAMNEHVETLGAIEFHSYRAFKSAVREDEAPYRFIDGEFVERFLDLDEGQQDGICNSIEMKSEDVRGLVEGLRRLH
ncbi:hypothetical protein HYFRA_00004827 [Hymenoscyphus fraxineus]|uniref:DNA damage-binding protein 1 n=1 Tax=Hymenoscyphus fraxineus TaxID=746836 RepID=A0A9N9PEJ4_9HELO|nr:hypothetical protein HYFRA_00004827 [Hymenoscyphus fraxineus]